MSSLVPAFPAVLVTPPRPFPTVSAVPPRTPCEDCQRFAEVNGHGSHTAYFVHFGQGVLMIAGMRVSRVLLLIKYGALYD